MHKYIKINQSSSISSNPSCRSETHIPGRTVKEWSTDHADRLSENHKKYYQANRDHILAQKKEYLEKNKEAVKEYRERNKEKIRAHAKEYLICELCQGRYQRCDATGHRRTKKHQKAMIASAEEPGGEPPPLDDNRNHG